MSDRIFEYKKRERVGYVVQNVRFLALEDLTIHDVSNIVVMLLLIATVMFFGTCLTELVEELNNWL